MFDSIHGRLRAREPARVVVEAGGLGYQVDVPLSTFDALPRADAEVRLLLHLVVREDAWRLFGFATEAERRVFRDLLKVSGVGPVAALALLSGMGPEALQRAVRDGDVKALTRVKGVGKKTAERVVLDLREPWGAGAAGTVEGAAARLPAGGPGADAVRALTTLGLEPEEAARRVEAILREPGAPAQVGDLVRRALRG